MTRSNEGKLSDFLDFIGWGSRALGPWMHTVLQDMGRTIPKVIQTTSRLPPGLQEARWPLLKPMGEEPPEPWGLSQSEPMDPTSVQWSCRNKITTSVGPEDQTTIPLDPEAEHQAIKDYSEALRPDGICIARDPSPLPSFLFLSFRIGISILYLCHHCTLEAITGLAAAVHRLDRNLPQDESYLKSDSISGLDDI